MKKLIIILFLTAFFSCKDSGLDLPFNDDGTQIEIYLLKEDAMENYNPQEELQQNDLEAEPWLQHSEIEFYDWSAHTFYLKNNKSKNNFRGRYFSVTANEEPLVTGFFYSMMMSYFPGARAIIIADDYFFFPEDVLCIQGFRGSLSSNYLEENSDFRQAMENSGLLKEGINVELLSLKKADNSTLKYTFRITNIDTEPIYVLDPGKMGDSRFHYYTNGVSLYHDDNYYSPENPETTSSEYIKLNWYYNLAPGRSITRTVELDGFNTLPSGNVTARFQFPGSNKLDSGEWKKTDGRIWMGYFNAERELAIR